MKNIHHHTLGWIVGILLLSPWLAYSDTGMVASVRHELEITLFPDIHRLTGIDKMFIGAGDESSLVLSLSPQGDIKRIEINRSPENFVFKNAPLQVPLTSNQKNQQIQLTVWYAGQFNDAVPRTPVNTDNPGYGGTGIVSDEGTFLLSGAGWYPSISAQTTSFQVQMDAPDGILGVTSGRFRNHSTREGRTISRWQVDRADEGISLSADRHIISSRRLGKIDLATYFIPPTHHLATHDFDAVADYIKLYEKLFGPYPFAKFAVVENFFPTGYGFPSYTLLGGRVLRLPFIIHTSLGHEIAHCWWGNGVLVDFRKGNWGEGLTAYVADYLYKERKSFKEAQEHRLQWLRNYALLIDQSNDFPLIHFKSRYAPPHEGHRI
jgi:hypothetical protein